MASSGSVPDKEFNAWRDRAARDLDKQRALVKAVNCPVQTKVHMLKHLNTREIKFLVVYYKVEDMKSKTKEEKLPLWFPSAAYKRDYERLRKTPFTTDVNVHNFAPPPATSTSGALSVATPAVASSSKRGIEDETERPAGEASSSSQSMEQVKKAKAEAGNTLTEPFWTVLNMMDKAYQDRDLTDLKRDAKAYETGLLASLKIKGNGGAYVKNIAIFKSETLSVSETLFPHQEEDPGRAEVAGVKVDSKTGAGPPPSIVKLSPGSESNNDKGKVKVPVPFTTLGNWLVRKSA